MNHVYSFKNRQNDEFANCLIGQFHDSEQVCYYYKLVHYHMKLAKIMYDHDQLKTCLILCNWALNSMIKALYSHKYRSVNVPTELTMNTILPLVHTDSKSGLDIAIFIGTMQHLSSIEDFLNCPSTNMNNVKKLVQQTEEVLGELKHLLG
ncbi:hypothetical protein ASD24_24205 [Paenibacillus sp. Root52]|uniref:hypothetical protein n=1 Tax=Paenibacillus sp. Root52 TaxID=1736552 RepID=UPI000700F08E|nr:hypothetical protein [Paenibacillus sp. Root52]KQY91216.1 hypothetical protein ASD24_24205 [Paenibacillus sp. Root52]